MKVSKAAVLEPNAAVHRRLVEGLKKAGLKVSPARTPEEIEEEHLIVLGPGLKMAAKVAQSLRLNGKKRILLAAKSKVGAVSYADGVLPLPVSPADLKARLPELTRKSAETPSVAVLDPVTQFYTFHHFKELLFIEVKRARRYGLPLAVGLVSIDPTPQAIKGIQKTQLQQGLALAIRRTLRDIDLPVQYAEEKSLLLMPHTDLFGAVVVAKRIAERVQRATFPDGENWFQPTVSIGVAASAPGQDLSFAELIRRAQVALHVAKDSGGNRVEFFDSAAHEAETAQQASNAV